MRIYKFGGASVKDASGVKNVAQIIAERGKNDLLVVVSAMGKTTNSLEKLISAAYNKSAEVSKLLLSVKMTHLSIVKELFNEDEVMYFNEIENLFLELECMLENEQLLEDYDFLYDQVVGFGELISTRIISGYLLKIGVRNQWVDARNFIITDSRHRDARVQWEETEKVIQHRLEPLSKKNLLITQGFIGRGSKGETTTLGREGSDYSAAIFGKLLRAESVSIWKDVEGVLNADPKKFDNTVLIPELTYNDAIELAYYGASVIHPKTIQPLKAVGIPLYVRSFLNIQKQGTRVFEGHGSLNVPCKILKEDQTLIEIVSSDFTFIAENHLRDIFELFTNHKVRVNIMQNSAIHFRCVIDAKENQHSPLLEALASMGFKVNTERGHKLLSIYQPKIGEARAEADTIGNVIMEQQMEQTAHFLISRES
ncbi:MAG: aspartate kinase [Bacteroidia bacterium]|jgi:aspartate kinase|nr:aspartate kinase [Bacteroidia bacterium]